MPRRPGGNLPQPPPMRFVGVDLTWADRKPSAIVVLEGGGEGPARPIAFSSGLEHVEEMGDFIVSHTPGGGIVGIDAPLVVPNGSGARPCDLECTAKWHAYDAGALPANKKLCGDPPRGGRLLAWLAGAAFPHRYDIEAGVPARAAMEVYPHPSSVALLGLERIFKYKRSATSQNQEGLAAFQARLYERLGRLDPPVELGGELAGRLRRNPALLRGADFERQGDLVDALVCAITVFHFWRWGAEKWEVAGSAAEGAILLPRAEAFAIPAPGGAG